MHPISNYPSLEEEMRQRVNNIASSLREYYVASDDSEKSLANFLRADQNFLGIILALTNLSQEKFLRILSAERFAQGDFEREWDKNRIYRKLQSEPGFAERIARLFLEGHDSPLLVEQVAAFYLDQLSLPDDWPKIIRDPQIIQNTIRQKLSGEYSDKKGDAIESIIREQLDRIQESYGIPHGKGQVGLVGKEVDHAIPSIGDPYVLVMSSYMETTSSSQTARANEQTEMYLTVQKHNIRYPEKRVFVNFVDGAGWLARRSDLRKLYEGCDYIVSLKTLDQLEAIICKHVPDKYFNGPKPQVEG